MNEANPSCDLYSNGHCKKYHKSRLCKNSRSDASWFTDELEVCDVGDACRNGSIFGNAFFAITPEQLELLKQGRVLYNLDEYGTFIMLKKEVEE